MLRNPLSKIAFIAISLCTAGCNRDLNLSTVTTSNGGGAGGESSGSGVSVSGSSSGSTSSQSSSSNTSQTAALSSSSNNSALTSGARSGDPCQTLRVTTPRGLACLQCMQPEAAEQAEVIAELLAESCLKNIALNYLVDGSFSQDLNVIYRHIEALSSAGRRLFIELYVLNGPRQRREETALMLTPERFRRAIVSDADIRRTYQNRVKRLVPLLAYGETQGVVFSIVPMLEDNLSDEAFEELVALTESVIPQTLNVAIGRNPCRGCYDGNEDGIPLGVFRESHSAYPVKGLTGGIVTNDGYVYGSLDLLKELRDWSTSTNNIFLLWKAERQGLQVRGNNEEGISQGSWIREDAHLRDYEIPDELEQAEIIRFLRGE